MSIKFRLLLSYIALLIIPVILSIAAAIIIAAFNIGSISNIGKLRLSRAEEMRQLKEGTQIFTNIKLAAAGNPDSLKDINYLNELDLKLGVINTGIVVRENDSIIYKSNLFSNIDISSELPKFNSLDDGRRDPKLIDNQLLSMRQQDFYFNNKDKGSIFIITNVTPINQFARKFLIYMAIAVVIILVFTNSILTFLVSRSIVKPLESLKLAAMQIKDGNLNFEMKKYQKDEIGDVAGAFEEMRCRLKSTVEQQIVYEDNRKELISSISHDLKTPITAVKGYVEGIMDGVADSPEKMDRYIKTIYTKANDLDKLTDELFLFSKLDLKKVPFNFEEVDINGYLDDCIDELQFDLESKGIDLDFNMDCSSPVLVVADREKLKRVIVNIIENAVKYMDKEEGRISITIESKNDIIIKIKDNGQGIESKDLPFIFDRFYRADPSRNTSTGGSGLGLAIAKQIIEGHGGNIWAESQEGSGTTICFRLKRVKKLER